MTRVRQDIARARRKLMAQAAKKGLHENFGQSEVRKLQDKYAKHLFERDGVWDAIQVFDQWCMNYTGSRGD